MTFIPESDVCRLVIRSKLPHAELFQDWVCEVVLPMIRKTGAFTPANLSRLQILEIAMESEKAVMALEQQIEHGKPQTEAGKRLE